MPESKHFPMPSGNRRKPTISPISVEAALNTLIYTTTDTSPAATLHSLVLIEEVLHDPARPPAKNLREFALKSTLCRLIEEALIQYRRTSELPIPKKADTIANAIQQIQLDSQQDSAHLLGWSFLYYRFVRVDMNISQESFGGYANIEARSLRRYKKYAVARVADKLIDMEWKARRRQHQRRLLSAIPTDINTVLIGREKQVQSVLDAFISDTTTRCYVTGTHGIGKTAFLATLTKNLIDDELLDYVVWISNPRSIDEIITAIQETVLPPHSRLDLRDVLLTYPTLIVLDDISQMTTNMSALTQLLDFLAPCKVCLASEEHILLASPVFQVHLEELTRKQIHKFVQTMKPDIHVSLAGDYADTIWEQVGGNPRAVQLTLQYLVEGNSPSHAFDTLDDLYQDLFLGLSVRQQHIWICLAAMNNRQMPISILDFFIQHGLFFSADLTYLQRLFIVQKTTSQNCFSISQSAQRFILTARVQMIDTSSAINLMLDTVFAEIEKLDNQALHQFCLQLLHNTALTLQEIQLVKLMRVAWKANDYLHNVYQWLHIFKRYYPLFEDLVDLKIAYSICLRQTNHLHEANNMVETLMNETGQKGDFKLQAIILVEIAILNRRQGYYELATECLQRAAKIMERSPNIETNLRIKGELVQMNIERGNARLALQLLDQIQSKSMPLMILRAEVLLSLSRLKECQALSYQILPELQRTRDYVNLTSLITTLARSYQQLKHFDKATDSYNAALSYAEQQRDDFAIARLKCNFAALMIDQQEITAAEGLLQDAESTQVTLNDKVGLETTRHNLQYLKKIKLKY
ncbi:MAG: ATP-binding protein [Anaerolineae bacterium]|nr:ATP-binding protein [Anaerolineae bacterium]